MALDRRSIERKDFPIGRRGYDLDAVDAHLSALAGEIEELKRASRRRTETLAAMASEQVRAIVEAAETSAGEIQRQAEGEAQEIRAEASREARSTREHATSQARDYVGQVSESTSTMLARVEAMETELSALIESLRTGGNRLTNDLQLLETNLVEVRDAVAPRPRFEAEAGSEKLHGDELAEAQTPAMRTTAEAVPERAEETDGARLIALNMALNGSPREETERYLSENFTLRDRRILLDEVYASVEG
jgi:cell division septum initiation protein DivIVA